MAGQGISGAIAGLRSRGAALLELSIVAVLLVLLLFGAIDFGRHLAFRHEITSLSREAANLISRGTLFPAALQATMQSGASLNLSSNGKVILTAAKRSTDGNSVTVTQQTSGGSLSATSSIGNLNGNANVPPGLPLPGQTIYIAEVFVKFTPVTPIGTFLGTALPAVVKDVSYF